MAKTKVDLTGQIFGRLTVLGRMPNRQQGNVYWECKCKCGNTRNVAHSNLKNETVQSCGRACPLRESRRGSKQPFWAKTGPKLDPIKAAVIRHYYADKENPISQQKLAEKFGVSKLTILNIVNGRTYKPEMKEQAA